MSSLWESNKTKNISKGKNAILPSLNLWKCSSSLAQGKNLTFIKKCTNSTIERISLFMFGASFLKGSMTVEASLVLPLFLFFFLNLAGAIEMMRLHGKLEIAAWAAGREICTYGSAFSGPTAIISAAETKGEGTDEEKNIVAEIGDFALSYLFVKSRVEEILEKNYLESAPVNGGKNGLYFVGSDLINGEDAAEIVITYQVMPLWGLKGFKPFLMENHFYGRLWTGYEIPIVKEDCYYLAENGEVYHVTDTCFHLRLKVSMIEKERLETARNEHGRKYRACDKCVRNVKGNLPEHLWIAASGDCFHIEKECPGLKRIYRVISRIEAAKYRPCSACAM